MQTTTGQRLFQRPDYTLPSAAERYRLEIPGPEVIRDEGLRTWLDEIRRKPAVVSETLLKIRHFFENAPEATSSLYYPPPPRISPELWAQNKPLLKHVNMVQPVARCWANAVNSGNPIHRLERGNLDASIYETLSEWFNDPEWRVMVYEWDLSKATYGTAAVVPIRDPDTLELSVWMPDPVYTWYLTDPRNVYKLVGIAEAGPDYIQYIHLRGEGIITPEGATHVDRDFGWLPAVVGYGIDLRHTRRVQGLPLVLDGLDASETATIQNYNKRLLVRDQTRSRLMRTVDPEQVVAAGAPGVPAAQPNDRDSIDVPPGGDAKFITPEPKIAEVIAVSRSMMGSFATASGIPADVLDPTLTESSQAAEAARIRAIPLIQNVKPFALRWQIDRANLVRAAAGMLEHLMTQRPVKYTDLKRRVQVDIRLDPQVLPLAPNEETQDLIAGNTAGFITDEDAARRKNPTKTDEEIREIAAEIRRRREAAGPGAELEQHILGGGRPPENNAP